jgi:hypothetical protein
MSTVARCRPRRTVTAFAVLRPLDQGSPVAGHLLHDTPIRGRDSCG